MDGTGRRTQQTADELGAKDLAQATSEIPSCCVSTIQLHARHNPMMVCSECKQIIKCFKEERDFINYMTFCRSRRRPVLQGLVEGLYTVIFRSYETSSPYSGGR